MSLSRRAATRGSTTPMRMPLLKRDEAVALGRQLDGVARVDLGELARVGEVGQEREAGLAGLLDEDADRGLAALLGRDGLLAGGDEEHLEPVDVALGDPVRRVEGERRLVVLAGGAELAELPERLGQAVLRLGVGPELEQPAVRRRGLGPLGGGRLGDRLVGQLALLAGQVDRALRRWSRRRGRSRGGRPFGARRRFERRCRVGWARGHAARAGRTCFLAPSGRHVKRPADPPGRDSRAVAPVSRGAAGSRPPTTTPSPASSATCRSSAGRGGATARC